MSRTSEVFIENAKKLLRRYPQLEPYLERLYNGYTRNYIRIYAKIHCDQNQQKGTTPGLIWVKPNTITEAIKPGFHRYPELICGVMAGRWDENTVAFEGLTSYRSIRDHFENGVAWEDTEYYQIMLAKVEQGIEWQHCTTQEDVKDRFRQIDALYESIKDHGYKTQREIADERTGDPNGDDYPLDKGLEPTEQSIYDEIIVNIGRDGQLIFEDGRHRLSIAKLLDVEKVPVTVLVRHTQYVDQQTEF